MGPCLLGAHKRYDGIGMKSSLDMGVRACQEGRFGQAVAILEATTQLSPNDPTVWLNLARAYKGAGETLKAIAAYQFVLSTNPPEEILAQAEQEMAEVDHRSKGAIAEAMRPVCEACGAMLPAARSARPWCLCGWNTRTPPVIGRQMFLADLFAYSAGRSVVVAFKRREDVYLVAKNQLRLQGIGTKSYPVDPRLAMGVRERMAIVLQDELRPVLPDAGSDALFRVRPLGQSHGQGKFLSWRQMVANLSEVEGQDISMRTPDTSLAAVMVAAGHLAPDKAEDARKQRQPNESVSQALLRLQLATLESIVAGAIGEGRLGPMPVRPISERLGELLIAQGLLERRQLKQALFLQSQFKRPLAELLIDARLTGPGDVQAMLEQQSPPPDALPRADSLGELLVASKLMSRTQLVNVEAEISRLGLADLEEFLRMRHLVPADQIDRLLSWRARKQELCYQGYERIGDILISQRTITSEALGQALMAQVDDPRPLGLLLASSGSITPEQLVAALEEQDRRRNRLAWREEEDVLHGTRPFEAGSKPAAFARATTRALTRVLVGDDTPTPPPGRRQSENPTATGKRKRRKKRKRSSITPWRLAAAAAIGFFILAMSAGHLAGRGGHKPPGSGTAASSPHKPAPPISAGHGKPAKRRH